MKTQPIKKAVFPVAGLGSRFLPATKANPKEMLPIVDKPLIQYAVEEAVRAGITHMIFITSLSKRAIEDHFDKNFELEVRLREQGKERLLEIVESISPPGIQFTYIRQNQPLGLGHAVLCAEAVVGQEPFAVLLADDLIDDSTQLCLASMARFFEKKSSSVIAIQQVPWCDIEQYGIVCINKDEKNFSNVLSIVEKPSKQFARSNLAAIGRYIFTPRIFDCLKEVSPDSRGEIQLTTAIQYLLRKEEVRGYQFEGKRYDCGSKMGYLQASIEFGLQHKELGQILNQYLQNLYSKSNLNANAILEVIE